jgi:cytochrome c2
MKRIVIPIIVAVVGIMLYAFSLNDKQTDDLTQVKSTNYTKELSEAKNLLDTKCMICHAIKENQDAMMAPPFAHIKKKYDKTTSSKTDFVNAIISFTLNPSDDKAQMYGALKQFKLMPNLAYKKEDIEKIANYIYENDFPEPTWCGSPKGGRLR